MKFDFSKLIPPIKLFKNPEQEQLVKKDLDYASALETPLTNPDIFLEENNRDVRYYDKMLLDERISSLVDLKKKMILSVDSHIKPASDEDDDIERAEFIQEMFENMDVALHDVLDNMLDAMSYGYKVAEKVWNIVNGKWVITWLKVKHSVLFDFKYDEWGALDELKVGYYYGDNTFAKGDEIDNKFLIFVYPYPKDGNYYGESELSRIYNLWYQKYHIYRWRGVYLQNFGMAVPIVKYVASETSTNELQALDDTLENFHDKTYFKVPSKRMADGTIVGKMDIEFKDAGTAGGSEAFEKAIDQIDKQIARKYLVPDKMGFTSSDGGSYALGKNQFDILINIIQEMHGKLERLINPMIKQVIDFNYANVEQYPIFQFEEIDERIEANVAKMLIDTGIIDKREKWLRPYLGIPEITEQEKEEIENAKEEDLQKAIEIQKVQQQDDQNKKEEFKATTQHPVNYKAIERFYDTAERGFIRDYSSILRDTTESIVKAVEKKDIVNKKDLKALKEIRTEKTKKKLKSLFANYYAEMYIQGKIDANNEIKSRLKNVIDAAEEGEVIFKQDENILQEFIQEADFSSREYIEGVLEKEGELASITKEDLVYLKEIKDRAFFITGETDEKVLKIVRQTIEEGIREGATQKAVVNKIEQNLSADRRKYASTIARTNASNAYNSGRMNFFNSDAVRPFIVAYEYSAILDNVTTDFCRFHDGQVIMSDDPRVGVINPPNHFNCRSLLNAILRGENELDGFYNNWENTMEPWGTGVPQKAQMPADGFGG